MDFVTIKHIVRTAVSSVTQASRVQACDMSPVRGIACLLATVKFPSAATDRTRFALYPASPPCGHHHPGAASVSSRFISFVHVLLSVEGSHTVLEFFHVI